jgi:hypothetical protein
MLIEQVDMIDPESGKRALAGLADMLRPAVGTCDHSLRADRKSELGGKHDVVAASLDGAADQLFVLEGTIDLGRVEEVDAEVQRTVDGGDRLRFVRGTVSPTHAHAA